MPRTSRKDQIKQAIMRKPKYGGPQGGRPQLGGNRLGAAAAARYDKQPRVSNKSAVARSSRGIKYLSRADRNRNYAANGPIVKGPSLGTEMNNYKHGRKTKR